MALLPYADERGMTPEAREVLDRAPIKLNIERMLANAERCRFLFVSSPRRSWSIRSWIRSCESWRFSARPR
jgi:hypothetical protein